VSREIFDAIREAMLSAQSDYLEQAAKSTTNVESAIANVIADALARQAAEYKVEDESRIPVNAHAYDAFIKNTENGEEK
jgi:hypothetical protein